MMRAPFFTLEMGRRLKEIRRSADLTQDEVAERMGWSGPNRKTMVMRIEKGAVGNPSLQTMALFLRACGARWSAFADLLERPDVPEPDTTVIQESGLPESEQERLKQELAQQVYRYQRNLAYPVGKTPDSPARQMEIGRKFQEYRIVANLIEHSVLELLRSRSIPSLDHPKYLGAARKVLGKLWRARNDPAATAAPLEAEQPDGYASESGLDPELVREIQTLVTERFPKTSIQTQSHEEP